MSHSLQPQEMQYTRLPCPSLFPRVCSNSCPLSQWCYLTVSFCTSLFSFSVFPSIGIFSRELALPSRWPKYWSFSFSIGPSNEYSGLNSVRTDWFDLLAVQGTLKSLLQHHNAKASFLWCLVFCSDFGAQENKVCHCFHFLPFYLSWRDEIRCYKLHFLNVEF